MEWTNEDVLQLLELYREHPVLWDRGSMEYKDRSKRHEVLMEIARRFGVGKEHIERKLKNLTSHFSQEIKKENESRKSGKGVDKVYKSKWFCYESMLFLKDKKRARGATDMEEPVRFDADEPHPEVPATEDELPAPIEQSQEPPPETVKTKPIALPSSSKNKKTKIMSACKAFNVMKETQGGGASRDQYTAFGDQVSMQIRKLPSPYARNAVKQVINTILFDAEMGIYDNMPSSPYSQQLLYTQAPMFSQLPPYQPPPFDAHPMRGSVHGRSPMPPQPLDLQRTPAPTDLSQRNLGRVSPEDSSDPGSVDSASAEGIRFIIN